MNKRAFSMTTLPRSEPDARIGKRPQGRRSAGQAGYIGFILVGFMYLFSSCGVYTFKDISIDYTKVKTIKISYFENKARYVDPQFSPQLTDKLRQKITQQTRLTQVQTDDASYDVSGYVSDFSVSTSGVSNQQASTNRLTVSIHIIFKNRVDDSKSKETDISRNFDYSANLSLTDAEPQLLPTIISNMTDEIFNTIFSNW